MAEKQRKPKALDHQANQAFLDLITSDDAEHIGSLQVDSGQIEIGDCNKVQITTWTACGDGLYSVWRGDKYIVIEHDLFNAMELDQEIEALS
jgi:predicted RNA-binding protein with TRAM domain